jgi:hypothetical protein
LRSLCCLWALLLAGCAGENVESGGAVRDSAGVAIAESDRPSWSAADRWTIDPLPMSTIGEAEGDSTYLLYRVFSALRLTDGTIVIGNAGSSQVRFYDGQGRYLRSSGRRGAGPAEFHEYSSLRMCRLTSARLLVEDAGLDRAHIINQQGENERTFTLSALGEGSAPSINGCFGDGSLLTMNVTRASLDAKPGSIIESIFEIKRFDTLGVQTGQLAQAKGRTRYVNPLPGGGWHYPYIPFSPEARVAAERSTVLLTQDGIAQLERRSLDGKLRALIRWRADRPSVSSIWERYKTESLAQMSEQQRTRYGSLYEVTLPMPDSVPAADAILVDALDHVWAMRYQLPWDTARVYEVFEPSGRWLGSLTSPRGLEIFQIGADFILGRHRDDDGVERVVVYRLNRKPR